ncbi:hypothetical protein GSI_15671 [Ganoderma sinense ZZ0214-1]|uniref:FAD-binding PCMH-type domain-containing protein n=1 Tax=Ganoderma sinense ZZ0214-1 TaxID=1077348 RepID=A0A2G8RN80_9APHY|nr:hypothetical protein GSI_15671 [Ganoderma sinense ZZ0214-1]
MQPLASYRSALANSARRAPGLLASARRTSPALLRQGPLGSRNSSSTSQEQASPNPQSRSSSSSNAPLAFVLGSALSGAAAYFYATSQADTASPTTAGADLNNKYGSPEDFKKAIEELEQLFPGDETVTTDPIALEEHGMSVNDYHEASNPSVVVFPTSTEDVVKLVKVAGKYKMPVIPVSGATSLEGHYRAPSVGGICVDMARMDKIIEIHAADSDVVCQPGIRWMDLNETLKKRGLPLFFPLDPAPGATIGGMLSTGCSGSAWC